MKAPPSLAAKKQRSGEPNGMKYIKNHPNHILPVIFIIRLCLLLIFLLSFFTLIYIRNGYRSSRIEYEELQTFFRKDSSTAIVPDSAINFMEFKNPDYTAWIYIPDTAVDYPVVQGDEGDFYLNHSFTGEKSISGCLFAEPENRVFEDDNTIIYGHNMKDGSMFSALKKYTGYEFYKEHPVVWFYIDGRWYEGKIFSCQIRGGKETEAYRYCFASESERWTFYESMKRKSLYETGVKPGRKSRIVTLSTCYGRSKRMIVQAVLMCYTE